MLRIIFFLSSFQFFSTSCLAQSVSLDKSIIQIKYRALPSNPVDDSSQRNYFVNTNVALTEIDYESAVDIIGFRRKAENPFLNVDIKIEEIKIHEATVKESKKEYKDNDGNITKVVHSYQPIIKYSNNAQCRIKDADGNAIDYTYGVGPSISQEAYSDTYKGTVHNNKEAADLFLKNNINQVKQELYNAFVVAAFRDFNSKLNGKYGYPSGEHREVFYSVGNKKHEEFIGLNKRIRKLKEVFSLYESDQINGNLKLKAIELDSYFKEILEKYNNEKKKSHQKMRFIALYNLAVMYYWFDQPDIAIDYAEQLIENGFKLKIGETVYDRITTLNSKFEINNRRSRHFGLDDL